MISSINTFLFPPWEMSGEFLHLAIVWYRLSLANYFIVLLDRVLITESAISLIFLVLLGVVFCVLSSLAVMFHFCCGNCLLFGSL